MTNIFPTDYPNKASADTNDVMFSSDWVTNFNLSVWNVATRAFANKTTTDLTEWSNLYYTDARALNVAVGLDWDDEVNWIKTFTSSPTVPNPTTPTQVANKAYVDAQGIPIDPLPNISVLKWDDNIVVSDGTDNYKAEIYDIFKLIPIGKTYATYTAWETITTWDVVYLTGGLAYKAHASSQWDNLIVVWVALEDANTSSTFVATTEGLSLIKEYWFLGTSFLSNTAGMLASTAWTFSVEIWSIANKQNWLTINDWTSQVIVSTLNTFWEDNTEYTSPTANTWVKATEFTIQLDWIYRVSHDHRQTDLVSPRAASQIYKNWVAFWAERLLNSITYQTFSENLTFEKWDLCQLYFRWNDFSTSAVVRNFNAKWRIIKQ